MELGVLGAGNMGQALVRGALAAGLASPSQVIASSLDGDTLRAFAAETGIRAAASNREVVEAARVLLLAVKPQQAGEVLDSVAGLIGPHHLVVSIAAGLTTRLLEAHLPEGTPVVRVMPNTPSLVGAGAAAWCLGSAATAEHGAQAARLLEAVGEARAVDEGLMDAVTAVSGSGPAYVFLMVEAMTRAGVAAGLDPELAAALVRQTVLGAARMVAETGVAPSELRRRVTSPGGTTAAAIAVFEGGGFEELVRDAVLAARERGAALAREAADRDGGGTS
ncbi:MAG: pyrroline-5-carboxylate reductase [Deltaproteobacteria bacterium]|nr:pyrroline-5-carboxylate reductase [Deltaproteobacteria bacterium]